MYRKRQEIEKGNGTEKVGKDGEKKDKNT